MLYQTEKIAVRLKIKPVRYKHCRPVDPAAYRDVDAEFKSRDTFDIWEKSLPEGEGWLGVVDSGGGR